MYSSHLALALAGCIGAASAFSAPPLTPPAVLRANPASSLCMSHGGADGVSRKGFLSLGLGLVSALALPPTKASADQQLTPEQMAEYKALLKQAFKIEGLIDATVEANNAALGSNDASSEPDAPPEKPPFDPYLDGPQTMFNIKDLKEGKGQIINLGK